MLSCDINILGLLQITVNYLNNAPVDFDTRESLNYVQNSLTFSLPSSTFFTSRGFHCVCDKHCKSVLVGECHMYSLTLV